MKKIVILPLLIAITVIACSRKTLSSKEPVIPQREASITPITNNTPAVSSPAVATDEATISQGKVVFEAKCGRCHALKNVSDYTEQRWDGILRTMAPRARLTETEAQRVAAYLKANAKK